MTNIPSHAERFDLYRYVRTVKTPSRLAPGACALKIVMQCPACEVDHPEPEVCEPLTCKCGLTLQLQADGVFAWREQALVAAE